MNRIKVSAEYPRPWWRRLLGLPAKRVHIGTGTVEPWPWVDVTPDIRCPGCHTTVTRTQRNFGRTFEHGPIVNELVLKPCGHRFEGSDAGRLYEADEQAAAERWREHNRLQREAGCKCGRPATHVRRMFGTLGGVPAEDWTCAEHVNVNGWQKGPGDAPWEPIPDATFDGMEPWVGPAERRPGSGE